MNPDLTTIKAAIEASRECEQAALPGELIGKRATRPDNTGGYDYAIAANIGGDYRVIAEFFQNVGERISVDPAANGIQYIYTRKMEPKYREALAVAVEALGSYGHADPSIISMANDAIAKIAAIVKEATP